MKRFAGMVLFVAALAPLDGSCEKNSPPPAEPLALMEGAAGEAAKSDAVATAKKELEEELGDGFTVEVVEELFVTACNGSGRLAEAAKGTVKRVYHAMMKDYFTKRIDFPLKVCLFKDKESYEAYNVKRDGSRPSTPYGFYRSSERRMVMNIATGLGTLSHELVHPLLANDFPDVPSWFNEGFASLYEQSTHLDDGSIKGLVNWRLPGLQKAIAADALVPLKDLMATTTSLFYGEKSGLHYAEARYLCLYLQEKGLLKQFYQEFKKGFAEEKTGVRALEKVLGKGVADIQAEWVIWAKGLKYQ